MKNSKKPITDWVAIAALILLWIILELWIGHLA